MSRAGWAGVALVLVGNGVADEAGRAGVWLAKVLDLVLRQAPAALVEVPTYFWLFCNETGVFEEGIGINGGMFTLAGGNSDVRLMLDVEHDCELAAGIKFKPSCCC